MRRVIDIFGCKSGSADSNRGPWSPQTSPYFWPYVCVQLECFRRELVGKSATSRKWNPVELDRAKWNLQRVPCFGAGYWSHSHRLLVGAEPCFSMADSRPSIHKPIVLLLRG